MRAALVRTLLDLGAIQGANAEAAFRRVERHRFLPGVALERAYSDQAIVTHCDPKGQPISSSSQPALMAAMLELLQLGPGMRVLEVGAGTGYNAALMADLVGPSGSVVTIDIARHVAAAARESLRRVRCTEVTVMTGDGTFGYAEAAPYDRMIVTCQQQDVSPWWAQQLVAGGILVIPLTVRGRLGLVAALAKPGDSLIQIGATCGAFMSARGHLAPEPAGGPASMVVMLAESGSPRVQTTGLGDADVKTALELLAGDLKRHPVRHAQPDWGLGLFLALTDPAVQLTYDARDHGPGVSPVEYGIGLYEPAGPELAILASGGIYWAGERGPLVDRLISHLGEWTARGRPDASQFEVTLARTSRPATGQPSTQPYFVLGLRLPDP
jgi:protein-L-isoaspartate(D-aspartate) O-methyltransferase